VIERVVIVAATEIGKGCRPEGPHGPLPCGSTIVMDDGTDMPMDGSECSCGCSAFEDYCDAYMTWYTNAARLIDHVNAKESE